MRETDLFAFDTDFDYNARLGSAHDDWNGYAMGYRRAVQLLVEHVIETSNDQDTLVYPIVFMARHFIELMLKRTLLVSSRFLDRALPTPNHHRIDQIWFQLRPLLRTMMKDEPEAYDLSPIDRAVKDFSELDPGSFAFRYSLDKAGSASLPSDLKHVNLRRFADQFEPAATDLEILCGWAEDRLSFKIEAESGNY